MKENASPKYEILSLFEKGQSERLLKLDKLLLAALTLVYALIALLNLGTLSFPTSVYRGETGDSFTLDFGQTVAVDRVWVNSNIAQGTLRFTTDDGEEDEYYEEDYEDGYGEEDAAGSADEADDMIEEAAPETEADAEETAAEEEADLSAEEDAADESAEVVEAEETADAEPAEEETVETEE